MRLGSAAASFAAALSCMALSLPVLAQAPGAAADSLAFELNDAKTVDGSCQLIFYILNKTGTTIEQSSYQFGVAQSDGKFTSVLLQFRPLPNGAPKLQQFNLKDLACENIVGMFVNEPGDCLVADGTASPICTDKMVQSTRIGIQFPWQP